MEGLPAGLLAGGRLILDLHPGMPLGLSGELVLGVKLGNGIDENRLKVHLLAVGTALGKLGLQALHRLIPVSLCRHTAALPAVRVHIYTGLPIDRRGNTVARFFGVYKEILVLDIAVAVSVLHKLVTYPDEAGDLGPNGDLGLFRVRIRQGQQRQYHQRRQHHREDSYSALFHDAKPLNLEEFVNKHTFSIFNQHLL